MKIRNNELDTQYLSIANHIKHYGRDKVTRNGNVRAVFGESMRHNMSEGFPLLTTKFMSLKNVFTELKWFLLGRTDLRFLLKRKCNIWNGDAHKNYLRKCNDAIKLNEDEFIIKIMESEYFNNIYGDLGDIYGAQWMDFDGSPTFQGCNQIEMILDLLKNDPDSRRIIVSAWNPNVLDKIALPSCHTDFQFFSEELTEKERLGISSEYEETPKRNLSIMFKCRSQDFFLGTPYNTASYGLILKIFGAIFNYHTDDLIHLMGDTHIYEAHNEAVETQLSNKGHKLPKLVLKGEFLNVKDYWVDGEFKWLDFIEKLEWDKDFELIDYKHDGVIKAPLIT